MRMNINHVSLSEIYNKFGRNWFATYSYYNTMDLKGGSSIGDRNFETKNLIIKLLKRGYLIRESGKKIKFSNEWNYPVGIELKERWRLSGKAMFELSQISDDEIELIDQDYADMAIGELIRC